MNQTEIGGYEIRFRHPSDLSFKTILITDPTIDQYSFALENGAYDKHISEYHFEVAVFDTDGIYSDFVRAKSN